MKDNEPLGLPKGTVRGIIALFVCISVIGAYIATFFTTAIAEFPTEILTLPTAVVFYYFGKREQE